MLCSFTWLPKRHLINRLWDYVKLVDLFSDGKHPLKLHGAPVKSVISKKVFKFEKVVSYEYISLVRVIYMCFSRISVRICVFGHVPESVIALLMVNVDAQAVT